jgi:hypothetical protein
MDEVLGLFSEWAALEEENPISGQSLGHYCEKLTSRNAGPLVSDARLWWKLWILAVNDI